MRHAARLAIGAVQRYTRRDERAARDRHVPGCAGVGVSRRGCTRYAVFMAVSILVLICSGGLVTSKDAGSGRARLADLLRLQHVRVSAVALARAGRLRLEHTHRLIASGDGMLDHHRWPCGFGGRTAPLGAQPRLRRRCSRWSCRGARRAACGVARGLDRHSHALLAQAFFALVAFMALTHRAGGSGSAQGRRTRRSAERLRPLRRHVAGGHGLIYLQLGLGAAMRHAHAGLVDPRFPEGLRALVAAGSQGRSAGAERRTHRSPAHAADDARRRFISRWRIA